MSMLTPTARAQSRLDELYGRSEQPSASPLQAFEAISRATKVPVNVLLAMDEGRADLEAAQANAQRIASAVEGGKPVEVAVAEMAGDEARATKILNAAYDLADELEPPAPPAQDTGVDGSVSVGEAAGGLGRDVATGALRGAGGAVEALGVAADEALRYGADPELDQPTIARGISRIAGDAISGVGEAVAEGRTEDYRARREGTQPGGDITSPSTWTLGEDPSILGLMGVAAEGIGSMIPIAAAPSARAAAVFGGLMGAGEGVENGRKFVEDAAATLDDNGRPEIEKLPAYQALTGSGMDHGRAVAELTRQAENSAGFRQGLVASLGGAATNRIMRGAEGWLGSGGRLTRAVKKASAGGAEEGLQEVSEGAASGLGIEAATGADVDLMADSFGSFVGGAMAGGGMGAAVGALGRGERPEPQPESPVTPDRPQPLGLPAPSDTPPVAAPQAAGGALVSAPRQITHNPAVQNPNFAFPGLPAPSPSPAESIGSALTSAPRLIEHDPSVQNPNWSFPTGSPQTPSAGMPLGLPAPVTPADGSGPGQAVAPALPSLGAGATVPDMGIAPVQPVAPPAPPAGPVEAIAQSIAAATPAPAPEPVARFPDQKPGGAILLGRDDGSNENAVFIRETPTGAVVRVSGREVELTPEAFDHARNQAEVNQQREVDGNVEPASAADPAGTTGTPVGLDNVRPDSGEGAAQGGAVDEGRSSDVSRLDRVTAPSAGAEAFSGDLGSLDVADGTDQLGGALTDGLPINESVNPEIAPVAAAALEAAPEPTDAQKEAGNYKKGHARWNGLDLSIENAKGSERRGKGPDGAEWSVTMPADYGYIRRSKGADGDHVDFYMGPNEASGQAFVIDQVDADTGAYDEAKVMLGYDSAADARAAHEAGFSDGRGADRRGGITKMAMPELKVWLKTGDTTKPVSAAARQKTKNAAKNIPENIPAPQRRPFISYVGRSFGGINPGGKAAAELRHRGITPRTAPGLFRRGGRRDLDNIVADEHPDLVGAIGRSEDGVYLSPQAIIDAIVDEVAGQPLAFGRHAEDQQAARDVSASRRAVEDSPSSESDAGNVPNPERDIRDPEERLADIEAAVDEILSQMPGSALTADARAGIIVHIDQDGGDIEDAVYDEIVRSERDGLSEETDHESPTGEISGVPFGDDGEAGTTGPDAGTDGGATSEGEGAEGTGEPEGNDGRASADAGEVSTPATEPGADGLPQAILPGIQGSEAQRQSSLTAAQRAEIDARQQQSKARRLDGNSGDAGPLFDEQDDMFADAAPASATRVSSPVAAPKIDDFGEKLGGARKDVWASYSDKMAEAGEVDIAAEPLSKSWPAPDYEKLIEAGVEPWKVSLIRVTRDAIPTKPQKGWKQKGWVENVTLLRDFANKIMDGSYERTDITRVLGSDTAIMGKLDLYEAVGHGTSLKGTDLRAGNYSVYGGAQYSPPKVIWEVTVKAKATAFSNMPRTLAMGDTKEEAIAAFKKVHASLDDRQEKARKTPKFVIYAHNNRSYFTVGTKIGSTYLQLRRVDDVKEARRVIAEEADALEAELAKRREIPADRRPENAPRVGIDHRSGADITPEQFGEAFGFRGVEFGNWVEGKRRQQDLNNAYDALMDLAGIIDVQAKAISLNGSLGLAFGARGSGGVSPHAAHFEPGKVVINLTKMNGAGSLAHEWFHAVDNYFAKMRTDRKGGTYITDNAAPGGRVEGVRPELIDAFVALRTAIGRTKLKERSRNIDATRSKAYWATGIELHARAFESYVIGKLQDQSAANDYLANVVDGVAWQAQAELSGLGDSYPYLTDTELETVRPAFDALFETIQHRATDKGVELFQRNMSEPVATLTGEELGDWEDIRQLGRKAEAWYRSNLVGREPVTNIETGWKIQFDSTGARKTGGRKGDVLFRLVPAIPAILEHGRVIVSEADNRGREEIRAVHKIAARVLMGGREYSVIAAIRERADGTHHYDLSMDRGASGFSTATVQEQRSRTSALEGDSAGINLTLDADQVNANMGERLTPAHARAINAAAIEVLKAAGIERVEVRVGANTTGANASYRRGVISILRPRGNWKHALDHEIIHALRDPSMWDGEAGLFTNSEWRALARAARANPDVRDRVEAAYPDLNEAGRTEEMVAELYADWAQSRPDAPYGPLRVALGRIQSFFRAVASALRGEGFIDAAQIMHRIANGDVGGRGPDGGGAGSAVTSEQRNMSTPEPSFAQRFNLSNPIHRARGMIGNLHWKRSPKEAAGWMSHLLTDAMGKDARFNALGLVPGRALFTELARNIPAAKVYLSLKEQMDSMRNDWQVKSSEMVDLWTKTARKNPAANQMLMEIMHESTLAGLDPSKDDGWHRPIDEEAQRMLEAKPSPAQSEWARITLAQADERREVWQELRDRYQKLPKAFRDLYGEVRDGYSEMADGMDNALIENIRAMSKVIVKKADREHRQELDRIRDEGLKGEARAVAIEQANEKRTAAHARAARGSGSRLQQMRQTFESNRLNGPYFPLARFGNYFVTIRDDSGKVTSFSRFETEREQKAWAEAAGQDNLGSVQTGVLGGDINLREQVDPRFLADVEELLAEAGASKDMMDQVWQRWLETLPDQSVRTNKIHRKGRAGFNKDAIRSFASSMFHGAHQMARLQYGAQMEEALTEAEDQASKSDDANRAGFVVREMRQRHAFTMAPTNNPWVTKATGLAFVWYLGVSPAAALVNLSQTTVVGVPLMAARYRKGGATGAMKELSRASMDFMRGKGAVAKKIGGVPVSTGTWTVENAPNLTAAERQAMEKGYQRGVIDKTQAHDLASVADSGVEYNPTREKVMRIIGWGFHHAERFNREVTYLAAYRMARGEGLDHDTAIESAASMTWNIHFDYSNSSRPRAMTGDAAKVFTIFKNFQVNMLFRLFRDAHQSLHGADAETKREARLQLTGVTLSLMAHAGIRGVWGYALLTTLLSWFVPGADDGDDIDEWLQDALLMEGDSLGTAAWNYIMAMALNGAPGHISGIDLTNRIGMPELLMRSSQRDLEGKDQWYYLLEQLAGPLAAIAGNFVVNGPVVVGQATNLVADSDNFNGDELTRAVEKVVPTFARNIIKTSRYASDGVTTWNGDPVVDELNPYQLLMQLQGFTPAEVSEQYTINNRLKNRERRITDKRQAVMRSIGDAIRDGEPVPESALKKMQAFNREYPGWPITSDAIRQSIRSRERASQRNEGGVSINQKLDGQLRESLAPSIY